MFIRPALPSSEAQGDQYRTLVRRPSTAPQTIEICVAAGDSVEEPSTGRSGTGPSRFIEVLEIGQK